MIKLDKEYKVLSTSLAHNKTLRAISTPPLGAYEALTAERQ